MMHLSRHLRLFKAGPTVYLEAILREQSVEADPLMLAVLRALERGPAEYQPLLEEVSHLCDAPPAQAVRRVGTLHQLGLIHSSPDMDAASLRSALEGDVLDLPIIDQVELTNVCPMSCLMCPTGQGILTRKKGYMDRALFTRIVDNVAATQKGIKPLTLHNLGESLLHQELPDFIRLATARGLQTELSANPGHLPLAKYLQLEEAGLSRLVLDVDGMDVETLEKIRGTGAKGARAFENLDALLARRRSHPTSTPQILIQMIKLPHNAHHHAAFQQRFSDLGIAGVMAYLKDVDANTNSDEQVFQIGRKPRSYLCRAPWRTVVILWDGRVVPCCHDADAHLVLGNLNTQTLQEIWHGDIMNALRGRVLQGTSLPGDPCFSCAHRPDRFARSPLSDIPDEPLHW